MNCEDFNEIIHELADNKPMAVSTRDAGVSHIALCADCAAKLAHARAVSSSLLLAAGAESEDAPALIKQNLLTAFAAQQQAARAPREVVQISSRRKFGWWAAAAVAAAAAVIVFAVILPFWKGVPTPNNPGTLLAVDAPSVSVPGALPSPSETPIEVVTSDSPGKTSTVSRRRRALKQTNRRAAEARVSETVAENTTNEYLPLTYLASATAIDTGTIVRVQLSQSALVRLGLPINLESSSELVRADVVLGDDGVALAIRLVQ